MQGESGGMSPLKDSLKRWIAAILVAGLGALLWRPSSLTLLRSFSESMRRSRPESTMLPLTPSPSTMPSTGASDETHPAAEMTVQNRLSQRSPARTTPSSLDPARSSFERTCWARSWTMRRASICPATGNTRGSLRPIIEMQSEARRHPAHRMDAIALRWPSSPGERLPI